MRDGVFSKWKGGDLSPFLDPVRETLGERKFSSDRRDGGRWDDPLFVFIAVAIHGWKA